MDDSLPINSSVVKAEPKDLGVTQGFPEILELSGPKENNHCTLPPTCKETLPCDNPNIIKKEASVQSSNFGNLPYINSIKKEPTTADNIKNSDFLPNSNTATKETRMVYNINNSGLLQNSNNIVKESIVPININNTASNSNYIVHDSSVASNINTSGLLPNCNNIVKESIISNSINNTASNINCIVHDTSAPSFLDISEDERAVPQFEGASKDTSMEIYPNLQPKDKMIGINLTTKDDILDFTRHFNISFHCQIQNELSFSSY